MRPFSFAFDWLKLVHLPLAMSKAPLVGRNEMEQRTDAVNYVVMKNRLQESSCFLNTDTARWLDDDARRARGSQLTGSLME